MTMLMLLCWCFYDDHMKMMKLFWWFGVDVGIHGQEWTDVYVLMILLLLHVGSYAYMLSELWFYLFGEPGSYGDESGASS